MVNMKKISIIALTILTLGMTSCDMDKMPYDAVPTEEALTTIVGFEEARAGIYSVYLGLTGGSYVLAPEDSQGREGIRKGVSQKTCHSYLYSCFYSWDRKMANCKK